MINFRFSLLTLFLLTSLAASLTLNAQSLFQERIEAKNRVPGHVNGALVRGHFIELGVNDRIYVRYINRQDSGADLQRVRDGRTIWFTHTERLGVAHSEYSHHANISINSPNSKQFTIILKGSQGIVTETRNTSDGQLIDRATRNFNIEKLQERSKQIQEHFRRLHPVNETGG